MNMRPGFRLAIVAAVVPLAVSCSSGSSTDSPSASSAPPDSTVPNPGEAFAGTYDVTMAQEVRPDLIPQPQGTPRSALSVTSFCAADVGPCVASALLTYPDAVPRPAPQPLIFDYADGSWTANIVNPPTSCTTQNGTQLQGPSWQTVRLEMPEGNEDGSTIAGIGTTHMGPPCEKEFAIAYTFTRTGPVDPALDIPPPDRVPPLDEAAGSALSGTYDLALTPTSTTGGVRTSPAEDTSNFRSFCTRAGDRCVSVHNDETDILPMFEWTNGTWSSDATYATAACADGSGQQQTTIRASLTNTDENASPAQKLTGELRKIYVGDCPGEFVWSIDATRTGA